MKSNTIREFDTRFTAVQFGFKDVEDYYRTACLHDKLDNIKVRFWSVLLGSVRFCSVLFGSVRFC